MNIIENLTKKYNDFYNSLSEEEYLEFEMIAINETLLQEMANLQQKNTNLPVLIWADSNRNLKHAPRIKFQNSYSTHRDGSELIPMTISDNPQIPDSVNTKLQIKQRDLNEIKEWVILNKDLLLDYFYEKIDTIDFAKNIEKI